MLACREGVSSRFYLAIYCLIYLCNGLLSGTLGPVIPYLSNERNVPETEYSFLFVTRTLGSIAGYVILRFVQRKKYKYIEHKAIIAGLSLILVFLVVFVQWKTSLGAALSMIAFGVGQYFCFVSCNICVLLISQNKAEKWIILINASFGVGALISPQLIRIQGMSIYYSVLAVCVICTLLCAYYRTPTLEEQRFRTKEKGNERQFTDASLRLQILVGLGLFLIAGIESVVTGWIPTYAVLAGEFTKDDATIYGSLFWTMSTIFRFIAVFLNIKTTVKLKTLLLTLFLCGLVCFTLDYLQSFQIAALFGALGFGMSCSAVFPLILSAPTEYRIKFKPEQMSNLLLSPILSSGFSTGVTGALMSLKVSLLFSTISVMSACLGVTSIVLFGVMRSDRSSSNRGKLLLEEGVNDLQLV